MQGERPGKLESEPSPYRRSRFLQLQLPKHSKPRSKNRSAHLRLYNFNSLLLKVSFPRAMFSPRELNRFLCNKHNPIW